MLVNRNSSWLDLLIFSGRGKIIAVSASKIKNKIVIIKNRNEKEVRNLCLVSKPHSNGDIFSRIGWFLIFKKFEIVSIRIVKILENKNSVIILLFKLNLLIGNQLYFLY
jgi:hypothetical protein